MHTNENYTNEEICVWQYKNLKRTVGMKINTAEKII